MINSITNRIRKLFFDAKPEPIPSLYSNGSVYAKLGSLSIIEISDASALAGDLFRSAFKSDPPASPRHFVMLRERKGHSPLIIGYVHYTLREAAYLAGGLVVQAMELRRLDPETLGLVRKAGGFAEWLMRTTCGWLDRPAVFAYMGDARSIAVLSRVGFDFIENNYLYVLWKHALPQFEKDAIVEDVVTIGPF